MAKVESRALLELLAACGGDILKACALSDLPHPRLYALLQQYALT